jgi:hypothetical protein
MSAIINPSPTPDDTDRKTPAIWRTYRRLLALPTGHYTNAQIRKAFGINGQFQLERLQEGLMTLEKQGYLKANWMQEQQGMYYRLTLNPLTEVEGIDALNQVDVLAPATILINHFSDLQEKVLGAKKTPTIADRACAKRLLKDVILETAMKMVEAYWKQRAERRNGSVFKDFYWQYPALLNDVVDEVEVERGQAAREARRNAPQLSRRDWLIKEIAILTKKGRPLFGLDKELEALNDED